MAPSDAHEVAAAMEMARLELSTDRSAANTPPTPEETIVTDKYAFAFDIDGVLIRGGKVIPDAVEAMKMLNGQNSYGIKMWVLLVNSLESTSTDGVTVRTSSSPTEVVRPNRSDAYSSANSWKWRFHLGSSSADTPQ